MTSLSAGQRGVLVYAAVALSGVTAISGLMHALKLSVGDGAGGALALAVMWIPALARLVATRTVDWDGPRLFRFVDGGVRARRRSFCRS